MSERTKTIGLLIFLLANIIFGIYLFSGKTKMMDQIQGLDERIEFEEDSFRKTWLIDWRNDLQSDIKRKNPLLFQCGLWIVYSIFQLLYNLRKKQKMSNQDSRA